MPTFLILSVDDAKNGSKEETGKQYKVLYLKDGRRRQLVLQKLFRAALYLVLYYLRY